MNVAECDAKGMVAVPYGGAAAIRAQGTRCPECGGPHPAAECEVEG